jgi:NADP-dependent aldehyde dehydrogenase
MDVGRDPRTGEAHQPIPHTAPAEVARAVAAAAASASLIGSIPPAVRGTWLESIAVALEAHADELVSIADAETALGDSRLRGELAKAAASLRFYAMVAADGTFLQAAIDTPATTTTTTMTSGTSTATSSPTPDLRRMRVPVGPVAVFGAGNFPFGFGVLGHDTASAIAAGCPVLVKAHPAHPLLSVRLGEIASAALAESHAPAGVFAVVVGFGSGLALVDAPAVAAVAFTGSQSGGMALVQRAQQRARPIPVFAEMGTVNPVVVTPSAGRTGLADIARGFAESFTMGTGQFCTKPGLLLAPAGSNAAHHVSVALGQLPPGWLLSETIAATYVRRRTALTAAGATVAGEGQSGPAGFVAVPTVFAATADDLILGSPLLEECFGPAAVVVEYADLDQLREVLGRLQPSLAAAIASGGSDDADLPWLAELLASRAGRVVVDGWPTGVANGWAQHHGGPWPATSRPDATSVGAAALDRFTRPVTFQGAADAALPMALRSDNPWTLARRVNGLLRPVTEATAVAIMESASTDAVGNRTGGPS